MLKKMIILPLVLVALVACKQTVMDEKVTCQVNGESVVHEFRGKPQMYSSYTNENGTRVFNNNNDKVAEYSVIVPCSIVRTYRTIGEE